MHAPLSVEHIPLIESDGHGMRRMAMWGVTLNIVVFMSTPFMLPASMASAGWGLGAIFLIYTCFVTYQSGLILGKICMEYPRLDSYPNIARAAFRKLAGKNALEGKKRRWERNGMWFLIILQCTTYYLTAITEMLTLEQLFGQLFSKSTICQWEWLIIVFVLNVLPIQIPSFNETVWMAALAGFMLFLKLFVLFYEMFYVEPWSCQPGPDYTGQTVPSTFRAFAAFMFAYGSHGMFPEMIREMKDVTRWKSAINWTYAIVVPMYLVAAFLGYFSYGAFAHANINVNFPGNGLNIMSLAVQLFLQVYLLFIPNLVVVMQVEIALGVKPNVAWGSEKDKVWGLPPVVFRSIFRTLFLGSQIMLSEILLTGEGDVILNVQAVAGAIGMAAFALFLPFLFDIILFERKLTSPRTIFGIMNIIIGIIVSIAGSYFSIQTVFDEATGPVGGECTLKYAYAPSDPRDPCYISGV